MLTFVVLSEVLLIALSAILGTYMWNHGSTIFNYKYNNNVGVGRAILVDMQKYWKAWIAFALVVIALVSVVGWRASLEKDNANTAILNEIH